MKASLSIRVSSFFSEHALQYLLTGIVFILLVWFAYWYLPVNVDWKPGGSQVGVDWKGAFRPAALALLSGQSPYSDGGFFNPPWVLLPLLPVALLSKELGSAVIFAANLIAYACSARRFGAKALPIVLFLISSGALGNSINCNIEGLLSLGYTLPPALGMFFVLAKPQASGALAGYWLLQSWRSGGWQSVTKFVLPVGLALAFSFALYGFWPASTPSLGGAWWNTSIWPKGLPIGLLLLFLAVRFQKPSLAISASPFFAPYLTGHTWASVSFGILPFLPGALDIWHWIRVVAHSLAQRIQKSN